MKKTFTLLVAAVLMTAAAFAQYDGNRPHDNNYGNNNYDNNQEVAVNNNQHFDRDVHHFGEREKHMKIDEINYRYDRKIAAVENSFFMSRHKKDWKISRLQAQRDEDINFVMAKFNARQDHYNQGDNHYNDHDRRNW